jgi:peptidoglycan glycosyltransferase
MMQFGVAGPAGGTTRRRPLGPGIVRVGLVLAIAFGALAAGAGYWQVYRAPDLSRAGDNPIVIAARRNALRGLIRDRAGTVLASNKKDKNGEPYRVYRDVSMSQVIGYASRFFGTAGLERTYDAELTGLISPDAVADALRKFQTEPYDPQDLTLSISLPLQRAAVRGLGSDKGAVVMLDPKTGQVLALASTPTYNASTIANPATGQDAFAALQKNAAQPLLPRATQGRYVPGSVFKIVTEFAGLGSGASTPATTFAQQPAAEKNGLLVSGFRVHEHPGVPAISLDLLHATEVSSNIFFALVGLKTSGEKLADWAGRLGFGAPIPFELPTAPSQVTNGGGSAGGGFSDRVEIANASYGQAETLVTPLQMALVAATVANGGVEMKPYLVTAFSSTKSGKRTIGPQQLHDVVSPNITNAIRDAMVQAVEGDLGRQFTTGAQIPGVTVAGKSGTAELGGSGEPHSWFIGFAPAENPKVAIAVLVEQGGRGAERAAPLAGQLMKLYLDQVGS